MFKVICLYLKKFDFLTQCFSFLLLVYFFGQFLYFHIFLHSYFHFCIFAFRMLIIKKQEFKNVFLNAMYNALCMILR